MYSISSSFPSAVFAGPLRSPLSPLGGMNLFGGSGTAAELNSVPGESFQQDELTLPRMINLGGAAASGAEDSPDTAEGAQHDAMNSMQSTLRDFADSLNEAAGNPVSEAAQQFPVFESGSHKIDMSSFGTPAPSVPAPDSVPAAADAPKPIPAALQEIRTGGIKPAEQDVTADDMADALNEQEVEEGQRKLLEMIDNIGAMMTKREVLAKNMDKITELRRKRYTDAFIADIFQKAFNFRSPITAEDIERAAAGQ